MNNPLHTPTKLSLVLFGANDFTDRAVRFYRKYFWTFVLIASPPVIVGTLISVGWTVTGRQIFSIGANQFSAENTLHNLFVLGSILIWLVLYAYRLKTSAYLLRLRLQFQ